MWMTVNSFWTQVAESLWDWSMLQRKRNCLMQPERVFTSNRPFTKDSGAIFLTLLGIFGQWWIKNLMDSLVSSRNIIRQEGMKKLWNFWNRMSYNTIQRKNEKLSKQSRVSHWCELTSGQVILTQNQIHRTKRKLRKVEKQCLTFICKNRTQKFPTELWSRNIRRSRMWPGGLLLGIITTIYLVWRRSQWREKWIWKFKLKFLLIWARAKCTCTWWQTVTSDLTKFIKLISQDDFF